MRLITMFRIIKLGWINYWRNKGLSISATLILSLTLFIVVLFMLVNGVLAIASGEIRDKIDRLDVTFKDEVPEATIQELQTVLAARSDVKEVHYVSKEDAIERFRRYTSISERARESVTDEQNPFPRSLEIKATTPDNLEEISNYLSEAPRSEMIRRNTYHTNKDVIQRLSKFERGVTASGFVLSIIFIVISLIVVLSTVRLAIFARREEIEIMRLVGANNLFTTVPFVVEGILYGIVASAIALAGAWAVTQRLGPFLNQYLRGIIPVDLPALFLEHLPLLIVIELSLGLGIAILASLISIQRYLKR